MERVLARFGYSKNVSKESILKSYLHIGGEQGGTTPLSRVLDPPLKDSYKGTKRGTPLGFSGSRS